MTISFEAGMSYSLMSCFIIKNRRTDERSSDESRKPFGFNHQRVGRRFIGS
jgi:hypothetical protein